MIATTIINSIKVKPFCICIFIMYFSTLESIVFSFGLMTVPSLRDSIKVCQACLKAASVITGLYKGSQAVVAKCGVLCIFVYRKMTILVTFYSIVLAAVCLKQDRKSTRLNSSHVRISYAV